MISVAPCREKSSSLVFSTSLDFVKGKGRIFCCLAPSTAARTEECGSEPDSQYLNPGLTTYYFSSELLKLTLSFFICQMGVRVVQTS